MWLEGVASGPVLVAVEPLCPQAQCLEQPPLNGSTSSWTWVVWCPCHGVVMVDLSLSPSRVTANGSVPGSVTKPKP